MKNIIKIRIGLDDTIIKYSSKHFDSRMAAIKAAIFHLKRIEGLYEAKRSS